MARASVCATASVVIFRSKHQLVHVQMVRKKPWHMVHEGFTLPDTLVV